MHTYSKTDPILWTGRKSGQQLYLHEKVICVDLNSEQVPITNERSWAILGYACDEGVKRNEGRIGAALGPDAIRKQLAKLPNHLRKNTLVLDTGTVDCQDGDLKKHRPFCRVPSPNCFSKTHSPYFWEEDMTLLMAIITE